MSKYCIALFLYTYAENKLNRNVFCDLMVPSSSRDCKYLMCEAKRYSGLTPVFPEF